MKKEEVVVGARIRVKNGEPVRRLVSGAVLPGEGGRAPFSIWPPGEQMHSQHAPDGEEFEIVLAPRRKKVVYGYFECAAKFVALRRVRDGLLCETFYISVRFDAVPA